ncbi:tetratricopeptide repeat protein [Roseomonas sp. PWR1]|uniref:Tetratricopeptide repeat protein n=1 Tax=Roseomonas nitratireducens TaxID=2820810 RepID=A0ABS4AY52_9PROT|nr:tetratricopeptide repeat protein [Neoroseomonas nitratireducens]
MTDAQTHLRAAEAALRGGRPAEAEQAARAAIAAAPADPATQHVAGMVLLRLGRVPDALGPLATAAAAPDAPVAWVVALGNAEAMAGRHDAAEATLRRALAREPANAVAQLNLGILLTGRGDMAGARAAIEASLAARPDQPGALMALGNVAMKVGDAAGAAEAFARAAASRPGFAEAEANLGAALAELGRATEAEAALRRALARNPGLALARLRLGDVLLGTGRAEEAATELKEALAREPRAATGWNSLGLALRALGRMGEAATAFRSAVAADQRLPAAHANLALLLAWTGEAEAARAAAERARQLAPGDGLALLALAVAAAAAGDAAAAHAASLGAVRARPFVHVPARGTAEATVLVLQAIGDGHFVPAPGGAKLPDGHNNASDHLDPARFARVELFVDAIEDDPGLLDRLPRCDVIYNAITEPEGMRRGLALAGRVVERLGLPVINHPGLIDRAARDSAAALLADIDGLLVPRVIRVPAAEDTPAAVIAALEAGGLPFPVILRPAGTHTGHGMVLAHSADDLDGLPSGVEHFATEFVDFRDEQGLYRKTRLLLVGGRILAEHLATADHWNIHHANSRAYMRVHPEAQALEQDYLANTERHLGAIRLIALGEVADRMGLDFLGVDAALLPDGRLLVFEANPSMRAMFSEARRGFEYLLPGLARLSAAFCDLVLAKARG